MGLSGSAVVARAPSLAYGSRVSGLVLAVALFFFQAEDGIRDLVRSRGLGDVYKRQISTRCGTCSTRPPRGAAATGIRSSATERSAVLLLSLIHI